MNIIFMTSMVIFIIFRERILFLLRLLSEVVSSLLFGSWRDLYRILLNYWLIIGLYTLSLKYLRNSYILNALISHKGRSLCDTKLPRRPKGKNIKKSNKNSFLRYCIEIVSKFCCFGCPYSSSLYLKNLRMMWMRQTTSAQITIQNIQLV